MPARSGPEPPGAASPDGLGAFVRRALVVLGLVLVVFFLWKIARPLVLTFAAVLFAVLLRSLANPLGRRTPLSARWAVLVVALALVGLAGVFGWLVGPHIAEQFQRLTEGLPQTLGGMEAAIRRTTWGDYVLDQLGGSAGAADLVGRFQTVATALYTVVFDAVFIFFVGLFFALEPERYVGGVVMLIPRPWDGRVREALGTTGAMLQRWLLGKALAMGLVGVLVWLGLTLLGVPLPLALGFLAGLLDFVPFFGPTVAALPGILIAFTVSPATGLYVLLLYLGVQQLEGNVITPLVQREVAGLAPGLILLAVLVGGLLFGLLGALVATPLLVAGSTLVKLLYVEEVLGKEVEVKAEA